MDQTDENAPHAQPRLTLPREFMGFPWFAWVAAAVYLYILVNLLAPYF